MQSSGMQFSRIFESGKYMDLLELSDANLRTDDGCNFDIHRVILAKSNDYFRRMFVGMGNRRRKFHIPGISGICLSDILCYIYTGDLQITDENIVDLIIGADYLLVEDLQKEIIRYIEKNLTEVNCSRILLAAHQISDEYIFRKCFRFIQTRFEGILRCQKDDLVHFPVDVLEMILSNRSLYVYNETTVWNAIVAWTQKDILHRKSCVPRLLLTLATEDMGEELATEILQHEIIAQNSFMKDLAEITSSKDLSTNLDVCSTLLRSYSNCFTEPILRHRIPSQLFVLIRYMFSWRNSGGKQILYISYDENADLWRKIAEVSFMPKALIVKGHNIYIFDDIWWRWMNFDLSAMNWVGMEGFNIRYSSEYCIVATDVCIYVIYVLGNTSRPGMYVVQVYDTVNNRWRNGVPLRNILNVAAAAIEKKVYVVGNSEMSDGMMMQMFDPDTQQWSIMSPPTVHHSAFSVVAYHQKIYLIGGSDAEVFDPVMNLWKELPSAFDKPSSPKAMVINDQIIVSDTDRYSYYVCWNNAEEYWEDLDEYRTIRALCQKLSIFDTVDDVEAIRMITKQNRHPETQMKVRYFH